MNNVKFDSPVNVIDGFDNIWLWMDRPELPFAEQLLWPHCAKVDIKCIQPKFQANRKLLVCLHQPTTACLKVLRSGIGREVGVAITYVEIARDILVKPSHAVPQLRDQFLASARVPYQRDPVMEHKETWYYGRRTSKQTGQNQNPPATDADGVPAAIGEDQSKGRRKGHVLAAYADNPSKLNNAQPDESALPCLHIEWRASGKAALESVGVRALDDLLRFDFDSHWDAHVLMLTLPSKTALGRLLARINGGSPDSSSVAFLKRANRWLENQSIKGRFVLHNALQHDPELARNLPHLSFREWLQASSNTNGLSRN